VANDVTTAGLEAPGRTSGGTARLVLEGMRPRQWLKNAFVLGGLMFSGTVTDPEKAAPALAVFATFCLASGATYLFNDVVDADSDRHNPRTASRPVARGALSQRAALTAAVVVAVMALAGTALVDLYALLCLAGFVGLQIAYSLKLKHVLFLDVMALAAGFVLRALAGLVPLHVGISEWLLLCTGLLALVLALGKRRTEVVALGGAANPHRPVLDQYSVSLVDELLTVVTPSTVVAYCLYAAIGAKTQLMLLTVPFVLYGVFRILYLLHYRSTLPEDPSVAVLDDAPLLACVALWGLTAGTISVIAS
jgi:4-hydroxybenzoate polyprenyltransferase